MDRTGLLEQIARYQSVYADEILLRSKYIDLLQHPRAYFRDHLPGHITGSAWIVNEDYSKVLLVLHAKLGRWLQPGGHADGEEDVIRVAHREAQEETGLTAFRLLNTAIFDLDIHPIPERKDFAAHLHYDIRFLFQASEHVPLQISDESTDLRWWSLDDIKDLTGNATSVMRMVSKTSTLSGRPTGKNG